MSKRKAQGDPPAMSADFLAMFETMKDAFSQSTASITSTIQTELKSVKETVRLFKFQI